MENIETINDELESESRCNQDDVVSDVQIIHNPVSTKHPVVANDNIFTEEISTRKVLSTVNCAAPVEEKDGQSTRGVPEKGFAQELNNGKDLIDESVKCALVANPNDANHFTKSDADEMVDIASKADPNITIVTELDTAKPVEFNPTENPDTISFAKLDTIETVLSALAVNQNDTPHVTKSDIVDTVEFTLANPDDIKSDTDETVKFASEISDSTERVKLTSDSNTNVVNRVTQSETVETDEIGPVVNQNDTNVVTTSEIVEIGSVVNQNDTKSAAKSEIIEIGSAVNQNDKENAAKSEIVEIISAVNQNVTKSAAKLELDVIESAVNQNDTKSTTKSEIIDIGFAVNHNDTNNVTRSDTFETIEIGSAVNQNESESATKSETVETELAVTQTDANGTKQSNTVEVVEIAPTENPIDTKWGNLVLGVSEAIETVTSASTVNLDDSDRITKLDAVETIDLTAHPDQRDHPNQDDSYDSTSAVAENKSTSMREEIMLDKISRDSDPENIIGNDTDKDYLSESESDDASIKSDNLESNSERLHSDKNETSQLDDDEDRRKPQYIPRRGDFFGHDDRWEDANASEEVDTDSVKKDKKVTSVKRENKLPEGRWQHDKFDERQQACKTSDELVESYGYDIREDEAAPKSRRRNKYKRGVSKYDRKSDDVGAYVKRTPKWRGQMRPEKPETPKFEAPEQSLPADNPDPSTSRRTTEANDRCQTKNANNSERSASANIQDVRGGSHRDNDYRAQINFRERPRHLQRSGQGVRGAYPDNDYGPPPYNQPHRPHYGGGRYDRRNNSGPGAYPAASNYYGGRPREFHRRYDHRLENDDDGNRRMENRDNAVRDVRPTDNSDRPKSKDANTATSLHGQEEDKGHKGNAVAVANDQRSGTASGDGTADKKSSVGDACKTKVKGCPPGKPLTVEQQLAAIPDLSGLSLKESSASNKRPSEEVANVSYKPEKTSASNKRQSEEVAKPVSNKPESKRYSQQRQRPFPIATAGNVVYGADPCVGAQPEPSTSYYSAARQPDVTGFKNNQSQPTMPQEENALLPSGQRQLYGLGAAILPQCDPYPNQFAIRPVQKFQQPAQAVAPKFPAQMGTIRGQPVLPTPHYQNQFPTMHAIPNEASARQPLPLQYNAQAAAIPFRPAFRANIAQQRLQYPGPSANVDFRPPTSVVQVPSYPQAPESAPPYPNPSDWYQQPVGVTYYNTENQIVSRVPPTPREKKTLPIINPADQSTVDLNVEK